MNSKYAKNRIDKLLRNLGALLAIFGAVFIRFFGGKKISLYGFYGAQDDSPYRNHGDNAILEAMIQMIGEYGQPLILCLLEENMKYSHAGEIVSMNKNGLFSYLQWLPVIRESKVLVMGGGGLFQDYKGEIGIGKQLWMINLLFWLAKRKIIWWSQGIGPLKSSSSRYYAKAAANFTEFISLRDKESRDLLVSCGVSPYRINVSADLFMACPLKMRRDRGRTRIHPSSSKQLEYPLFLLTN